MSANTIIQRFVTSMLALIALALGPVGLAFAQVQVTSADPSSAVQGTVSMDVTISGSGFDATAAVQFLVAGTTDTGGVTVKKVVVRGSKKLVATIDVADTATTNKFDIEVTLSDGRKGKGTTLFTVLKKVSDPCSVAGLDFPAFAFWRPAGQGFQVFVADATGRCVRSVTTSGTGSRGTLEFSYPVVGLDDVTRGRVAWVDAADGVPLVVAVDFTVAAGTNQVSANPRRTLYSGTGGYISLSRDGRTLYTNRYPPAGGTVIEKVPLEPLGTPVTVFSIPPGEDRFPLGMSVNGDESLLVADYRDYGPSSEAPSSYQLVWIPLDGSNTHHVIDVTEEQDGEFSPAASPDLLSNRLAYQRRTDTSGTCSALITSDINGSPTYPSRLAVGVKPTWLNGKILADGRAMSSRRNSCSYTGTIMQTDPITGEQTALTTGYDPDGR